MDKKAVVYTYSVIFSASEDFKDMTPFALAIVDDGEEKFLTRLEGYESGKEIKVGMEVAFSRLDDNGKPLYKFI